MEEIKVSVNCITYNHEKYIEEAIKGFLMQKTNFKFEVLIHDDASTDNTVEIVREYEKKYPDIIKLLAQKENQYSKGGKPGLINNNRAKGKYIALCEGDDYWIDEYKLQKQYDYMEKNSECSLVFSNAQIWDCRLEKYVELQKRESRRYTTEEIIKLGGGFVPTATIFYKKIYMDTPPKFYINASIGDYPLQMHLASKGKVYCLDDVTAVYRFRSIGSWTEKEEVMQNNIEQKTSRDKKIIRILQEFNKENEKKYNDAVQYAILPFEFEVYIYENNVGIREIKKTKFEKYFVKKISKMNFKQKIIMYIKLRSTKNYIRLNILKRKIEKWL